MGAVKENGASNDGVFVAPHLFAKYVAKTSFNGSFVPSDPLAAGATFTTSYDTGYDAAPTQGAVVGAYSTNLSSFSRSSSGIPITVASDGTLAGTTPVVPFQTPCTLTGFVVPTAGKGNLYDLRITYSSNCGGVRYNGVGLYDNSLKRLTGYLESDPNPSATKQVIVLVALKP